MEWCPRCGQGWVVRCRVHGREEEIQVCEECDTVWGVTVTPTNAPPFVILDEFMARFDMQPLWSNLDRLERGATGSLGL